MSQLTKERLANVLLAEDALADIEFLMAKMELDHVNFNLSSVRDGEEALKFLNKEAEYKEVATPDMIFLDLSLPKIDGKEILLSLKRDPMLPDVPVVILSGSDHENDIEEAKNLGAVHYLTKPLNYAKMAEAVSVLKGLYFESDGKEIFLKAKTS